MIALIGLSVWLLCGSVRPLHAQAGDTNLAATLQARLGARPGQPDGTRWFITDLRQDGDHAVAAAYRSESALPHPAGGQVVLAQRSGDGWQVALAGDAGFAELLAQMPDALLDPSDRAWIAATIPAGRPAAAAALAGYRLPWPAGQNAHVTQNYSEHGTGQIDFWLLGDDIAAAKAGEIVYINDSHTLRGCSLDFARYNNVIVIRHTADEYTIYAHVATGSVPTWIKSAYAAQGTVPVTQGTRIARQGNVGFTCGGDGIHLHLSTTGGFSVWSAPDSQDEDGDGNRDEPVQTAWGSPHQAVDFAEVTYAALTTWPYETLLTSQNNDRACSDAVASGVALFAAPDCHGDTLALLGAPTVINLPDRGWNDRAQAIAVAPGWSTRVYEHIDEAGASRCIATTLPTLADEHFDDGATAMAGEISSLAVYQGAACAPPPVRIEAIAAPAELALVDGASQIVTVTMRTTATLGVHLGERVLSLETSAGTPLADFQPQSRFTDITLDAAGEQVWVDEVTVPEEAIRQAWGAGFTRLLITLRYTGSDALGRPVAVSATWPFDLAACGMAGEWNGDSGHATPLAVNSAVRGTLCPAGDRDHYTFAGAAGQTIWATVETVPGTLDPALSLYALDTITPLIGVDDIPDSLDALLMYTLPVTGQYILAVEAYDPPPGVTTTPYTLTVSSAPMSLSACVAASDSAEPDDIPAAARPASVDGRRIDGSRHANSDRDWFAFQAVSGVTYAVELGGKATSRATLYATDAVTPLATAALSPTLSGTVIVTWTAAADAIHFVEVTGDDGGCTAVYNLRITAQDSTPPGVTLVPPDTGYTNAPAFPLAVVATDTGSGVDAIRIADSAAFARAGWTDVPTQTLWTLSGGDGLKTMYAQVRDRRGNLSQVATATVILDRIAPELVLVSEEMVIGPPVLQLPLRLGADVAELRWRVTGGAWSDWLAPGDGFFAALPDRFATYSLDIQARDRAGNLSTIRTMAVTIVPPALFLPQIAGPR